MLSERQKKLSRLQLEHSHTARGSNGLYVLYVSHGMGARVEGGAFMCWNVGADGWVRNMMFGFGVCLVTRGKEREKALCVCVGRQN